MARRSKSKPSKGKSTPPAAEVALDPGQQRRMEAAGVILLVFAAGLFFALLTFDPSDAAGADNLVGPVGARVAQFLIGGVGVLGYVVAAVTVIGGGWVLLGKARWPRWLAALSALGMVLSTTILAHLVSPDAALFGQSAGGVVGAVTAELLRSVIGPAGAALAAVGLLLVCLLGAADISFGAAVRDTRRLTRWAGTFLRGTVDRWLEAREIEKAREAEVLAEEQVRRNEVEAERQTKERKLKEKLDEKKRLAVLKATAKAEEKALAKIAAAEAKARIEAELEAELDEDDEEEEEVEEEEAPLAPWAIEPEVVIDMPGPGAEPELDLDSDTDIEASALDAEEEEAHVVSEPPATDDETDEADLPADGDGPAIIEWKPERLDTAALDEDEQLELAIDITPSNKTYELPPLRLLDYDAPDTPPTDQLALKGRASRLEKKLKTYGVDGSVTAIRPGPVVTTYEYQPAPGVKVSKIAGLSDDIAMSMEARSVRIIAPIPGKGVVGIELPNDVRETVYLKEIIAHERFRKSKSLLTISLGKDVEGEAQVRNLAKMPHVLVAGTTGSGKSVSTNAMILSILYKATPDQVKFIMVDPKMLELSLYEGIPHLLLPVVTDPKKASLALQWAVDEMERRYKLLSGFKVRNIEGFNKKLALLRAQREKGAIAAKQLQAALQAEEDASSPPDEVVSSPPVEVLIEGNKILDPWEGEELPNDLAYIVVLIDEFADLMCVAPRDVEMAVQRLAQKARAAGVHLIIATQRPSTDVITGVIKNNLPSRLSFRVASRHDSATIINAPGAENLLGMGDMLSLSNTAPNPERVHGAYVTEEEVQRVVEFWKAQGKPSYDKAILKPREEDEDGALAPEDYDEMYDQAVKIVTESQKASISALQRRLRVGYNRAARMIEVMEKEGIVSEATGPKNERDVLVRGMDADGPMS